MGLHPQAVSAFMLLVLDLLWRGYKVVLATHSPIILSVVWMLRRLKETHARPQLLSEAFGVENTPGFQQVARKTLEKTFVVHLMAFQRADKKIHATDISTLDPADDNEDISGWGGLIGFSSRYGEIVARAVVEAEQGPTARRRRRRPDRFSSCRRPPDRRPNWGTCPDVRRKNS